ncbi:DUF2325 domain-containing protein [Oharaeibacter diazotrophicus]|uniref:Uncharacterized protein DUF2325 n=1 Tax=Oharaeibacter diazotrophicus TaxID=1920512 RepID=A0A4R6RJZ0_9HYPH|nr:DUF2325 domain-containing protein [Oharaeibacter diazotrophicus]TDP86425.1 uncharacterized protein DUF2325 [Oharaeibacter diazotrophicus]BBE71633.1 hypothetical protein OHA_1_01212 [Pleomorphomonas sp. SM30]GLS78396.1 hypothetical protein GCM10007904_37330 [Oharaeibacter diazotrophicus]
MSAPTSAFLLEPSTWTPPPEATSPTRRRRASERLKIWDLPGTCHCVTIGTCLTLGDLRRTAVRLGLFQGVERMTDYELHGAYVHAMDGRNRASSAVQKLLEGKHAGMIRRAARCEDDAALEQLWDDAVGEGQIPGAFWALLTHPQLGPVLEKRIFGEVHMMSHLCGASHRGDARVITAVERQRAALRARLVAAEASQRATLGARDAEIVRLKRLVVALEPHLHAAAELREQVAALSGGAAVAAAEAARGEAERRAEAERARAADLEARLLAAEERTAEAERRADALAERLLEQTPTPVPVAACGAARCPLDLAGRRIAYIGGRPHTVARIRAFVERCNGCLLAHDGGVEQSPHLLDGILAQADVVFVPIDRVSHGAMERAKAECARRRALFAPLATCSLSSFAERLAGLPLQGGETDPAEA